MRWLKLAQSKAKQSRLGVDRRVTIVASLKHTHARIHPSIYVRMHGCNEGWRE